MPAPTTRAKGKPAATTVEVPKKIRAKRRTTAEIAADKVEKERIKEEKALAKEASNAAKIAAVAQFEDDAVAAEAAQMMTPQIVRSQSRSQTAKRSRIPNDSSSDSLGDSTAMEVDRDLGDSQSGTDDECLEAPAKKKTRQTGKPTRTKPSVREQVITARLTTGPAVLSVSTATTDHSNSAVIRVEDGKGTTAQMAAEGGEGSGNAKVAVEGGLSTKDKSLARDTPKISISDGKINQPHGKVKKGVNLDTTRYVFTTSTPSHMMMLTLDETTLYYYNIMFSGTPADSEKHSALIADWSAKVHKLPKKLASKASASRSTTSSSRHTSISKKTSTSRVSSRSTLNSDVIITEDSKTQLAKQSQLQGWNEGSDEDSDGDDLGPGLEDEDETQGPEFDAAKASPVKSGKRLTNTVSNISFF